MTEQDIHAVAIHRLKRAQQTLAEAQTALGAEHWLLLINRLYYAASALLAAKGLNPKSHAGNRRLFNEHFVLTKLIDAEAAAFYNALFDYRHRSDYDDFFTPDPEEIKP